MRKLLIPVMIVATLLLLVACPTDAPASSISSCDVSASSTCYSWSGTGASQAVVDAACLGMSGTIVSSCPTASLVGSCAQDTAGLIQTTYFYTGVAGDLETACTGAGGTWSAP